MELATTLIWTLRILLPVILFCIYFKLQNKEEGSQEHYPGPSTHVYSRESLLGERKASLGSPAPEAVANICFKNQEQAPSLFAAAGGRGGRGGQRREAGGEAGGGRQRGEKAERGEKGERGERGERGDREKKPEGAKRDDGDDKQADASKSEAPEPVVEVEPLEEKMHIESVLNYVAFNRKEQQRVFLPDVAAGAPPPPPPPPPRSAKGAAAEPSVTGAQADEANSQVQMVLRGSMKFKKAEVSSLLFEQLSEQQVEISQSTFTLMIEACVLARELKLASDFLLKMENAGYIPDSNLLDKVMDLYSQQKVQREREKREQAEAEPQVSMVFEGAVDAAGLMLDPADGLTQLLMPEDLLGERPKLSLNAPVFVPSFGEAPSKLSTEASPFVPIGPPAAPEASADGGEPSADADSADAGVRTKLKLTAKPFEPVFGAPSFDPTYDPYMYGWPIEGAWPDMAWEANAINDDRENGAGGEKGKGKGRGNGGEKGKGKGRGKGGESDKVDKADKEKAKGKVTKGDGKGKAKEDSKDADNADTKKKPQEKAKAKAKPKEKAAAKPKEGPQTEDDDANDANAKAKTWKAKAVDT